MEQSPRLSLPYVMPAQAQKHVTVNETFRRLDALTQLSVLSRVTAAEPGAPAEGDAYILPASPTGAVWSAYSANNIAVFQDGAWIEIAAVEGLRAWISDEATLAAYDGAAWTIVTGGGSETAAKFGVNTTADATNKLSVKSNAVLFDALDAGEGGTGDSQVKVNKEAAGDTASHLFQTAFSGRAELGLTGDDNFHIKVSPDNFSTTYEPLVIDKDTGNIGVSGISAPNEAFEVLGSFCIVGTDTLTDSANKSTRVGCYHYTTAEKPIGLINAFGTSTNNSVVFGGGSSLLNAATIIAFNTAATTTTASGTERMRLHSNGGLTIGSPSGGSKGAGTLNAQAVYDDNILLSCYVFEQALDGAIDERKWDEKVPDRRIVERDHETDKIMRDETIRRQHDPMRKFKDRIGTTHDPLTLDGYAAHWKEKRHLSSMPNETAFDPEKGMAAGEWIQRLVETVEIHAVLIEQANQRLKALESRKPKPAGT